MAGMPLTNGRFLVDVGVPVPVATPISARDEDLANVAFDAE